PDRARSDYRAALAALETVVTNLPTTPHLRAEFIASANRLAPLLRNQGQPAEAEQILHQTRRSLDATWEADARTPALRPLWQDFVANLAETQVQRGKDAEAAKVATELPRLDPTGWRAYRRAAGILARCVPLAEQDRQLSEQERQALAQTYGGQAINLLRQ